MTVEKHVLNHPVVCFCGKDVDKAYSAEPSNPPQIADVIVCSTCGQLYIFDENLRLQKLDEDYVYDLPMDAEDMATMQYHRKWVSFEFRFRKLIDDATAVYVETPDGFQNFDTLD